MALLGLAFVLAVATGSVLLPPATVAGVLLDRVGIPVTRAWPETAAAIVLDLRLPRALLAIVVGAALGAAGAVYQGLFRNPLADPYLIGVAAGAALGATLAIATGMVGSALGLAATPLLALTGALVATGVVYRLARRGDRVPVEDLLLAGIAVSAFLGAMVSWLQLSSGESLSRAIYWLMGGFSGRSWAHLHMAAPMTALGLAVAWVFARDLNALSLGDETARSLGVAVQPARRRFVAAGAMMAASAVAAAGLVGFVGLIVPHLLRLLVGPDHRRLIPASALGGAVLLVLADVVARTGPHSTEMPVGIVTALLGAPFFIVILLRERRRFWT